MVKTHQVQTPDMTLIWTQTANNLSD